MLGQLFVQLIFKIFNLCAHDPPTSQRDRQTDDMRSQDCALHYSASRGKNRLISGFQRKYILVDTHCVQNQIDSFSHCDPVMACDGWTDIHHPVAKSTILRICIGHASYRKNGRK